MKKQDKKIFGLFFRYFLLLLAGVGNFYLIYKIITPITISVLNVFLWMFTDLRFIGNVVSLATTNIEIAPACVAGSAFYLLLLLVLSTSDIKLNVRIKAILTGFFMLFSLNIIRILILIPMTGASYFEEVHWIFWHFISILFVVFIWFYVVKIYKIKSVPIYSDFKYLLKLMKPVKKSKRNKKNN